MKMIKSLNLLYVLVFTCAAAYGLEIDQTKLEFGHRMEGEIASLSFKIVNSSLKYVQAGIRPSCECITAKPALLKIAPGATKRIELTVDTTGYSGIFSKDVYIQSNDGKTPYITISVTGEIKSKSVSIVQATQNTKTNIGRGKAIKIDIFGSEGCGVCKKIEQDIIPVYEAKYGIKADVEQLALNDPKNYEKLMGVERNLNKPISKIPAMMVAGNLYGGKNEIVANLDNIFRNATVNVESHGQIDEASVSSAAIASDKLKIFPVIFAGLVDSINPCAFATIVFFLSYMSLVLKKTRLEVFFAGLVFIAGVFVTYFLIGVGVFKAVLGITSILKYSKILYLGIGIFVLYLSARQFYEAAVLKKTGKMDDEEIKLKLPEWIRKSIEKLITELTGLRFILPFVLLLAIIITLFELVCTGQVYLPAIIYLTSLAKYRLQAYFYLALYCFLFVVPLIIIFVTYYFGLSTLTLKRFFKDNIVAMKITMAVFFLTLAVFMIIEGV